MGYKTFWVRLSKVLYVITKFGFTIFYYKVGRGPIAPHRIFKGITMWESNWHFSLCIRKEDEDINPKLKQEGTESTIFFLKLVWLKSSKRCTPGMPGGIYFALHYSLKPPFFFTNTTYESSGFHKQIEIYCKLIVGLKENCKCCGLMDWAHLLISMLAVLPLHSWVSNLLTLIFVKWKQHSFPYNTSCEELRSQSYSNEV